MSPQTPSNETGRRPRVWALFASKTGDNSQVAALAGALELPYEIKRLVFNWRYSVPNLLLDGRLASLDRARSDALDPPWPDLVIAAGRRSVPVALWLRARSGGRTRIVQIGRPRAPLERFDLVVTTPQYGLPPAPNVVTLSLPLTGRPAAKADIPPRWRETLTKLPRPRIAVLVGGDSWPLALTADSAAELARRASARATRLGGSLMVSTSPRTGAPAARALAAAVTAPAHVHRFAPGADNPYGAMLALADEVVVTSDSISMLADACATAKPVRIYALKPRSRLIGAAVHALHRTLAGDGALGRMMDRLTARGLVTRPRDLARVHDRLVGQGVAAFFDETAPAPKTRPGQLFEDEADAVLERVRALLPSAPAEDRRAGAGRRAAT